MTRTQFVGHWVAWPYSYSSTRCEFDLFKDGRFEAAFFEGNQVDGSAEGTWNLIDDAIQWTYTSCKKLPRPRRPQVDKILEEDTNRFVLLERSGNKTELWRSVPCAETSTNFDTKQVRPFLQRIVRHI